MLLNYLTNSVGAVRELKGRSKKTTNTIDEIEAKVVEENQALMGRERSEMEGRLTRDHL